MVRRLKSVTDLNHTYYMVNIFCDDKLVLVNKELMLIICYCLSLSSDGIDIIKLFAASKFQCQ